LNTDTQCPAPKLDASYVTNPPPDGFAVGFVAKIACVRHDHTGEYLTTCQSDKTWSTSAIPKCTSKNWVLFYIYIYKDRTLET